MLDAIVAPELATRWWLGESTFTASHSPHRGRTLARCVRRTTLDPLLVAAARDAGATVHERFTVRGLLDGGGVSGARDVHAPLVIGADGRRSTIAAALGLTARNVTASPTFMADAYRTGLASEPVLEFFFAPPYAAIHFPADGGHHVVMVLGPAAALPPLLRRPDTYAELATAAHPELERRLRAGRQVSRVVATRALDGFDRPATGPGWALVGDASHFKHPAAVQGIHEALAASGRLARAIIDGEPLGAYESWRDNDLPEWHRFAIWAGAVPERGPLEQLIARAAADPNSARELVDVCPPTCSSWRSTPERSEGDGQARAVFWPVGGLDLAAVGVDEPPGDRQAETCSARACAPCRRGRGARTRVGGPRRRNPAIV